MKRRCVLIGLDAFDPQLARQWIAEGHLPHLARLFGEAARAPVRNPFGLFVGALWVSFASAYRTARHGFHCWEEIDVASYRWRLNAPHPDRYQSFWKRLGQAGLSTAAIDVPHVRASTAAPGFELLEWGCHDRHFGLHSSPPGRAADIADRFGVHPALGMDAFAERHFAPDDYVHRAGRYRSPDEERALLEDLKQGARIKTDIVLDLLGSEGRDLFVAVYGESHAIGHQQWHLHDPSHPRFDAGLREALGGDPILQVYREIDAGVGRIMAQADAAGTTFAVLLSHGMGPHYDGTHLLEEILARLDRAYDDAAAPNRSPTRLRRLLPRLQDLARRLAVPAPLVGAVGRLLRSRARAARARRRFFLEPNNFVFGGIRINRIGREPQGRVPPEDYDGLCARLERDLADIVDDATGRPIVRGIERTDRHHRRSPDDTMPDLLIDWDRTGLVERVSSPLIGRVEAPYVNWRTGDHRPDGLLLVRSPELPAGCMLPAIDVEDIGPSLASRFGVELAEVDGVVVPWLAGQSSPAGSTSSPASVPALS